MSQASATDGKAARKKSSRTPTTPAEEEIQQLVGLCRAGKLFAVQEWIAAGKPVNAPLSDRKGVRPQSPLDVAIDRGFHSLVEILLKAGAVVDADKWNGPMDRALEMRRLDIAQLLMDHGYDIAKIRMSYVFSTWDPEIMEYFIERGADVETGYPLAEALRNRIRTALRVLQRYKDRFPHFQKQANIALRHHCREGDIKWVSLMLWAGADPYDEGSDRVDDDDDEGGWSALQFAAIYERFEVFKLRGVQLKPDHPVMRDVLTAAVGRDDGLPLAEKLLKLGVTPNDPATGGCAGIQSYLDRLSFEFNFNAYGAFERADRNIDSSKARQKIKAIHLLAKAGGQWCPKDSNEVSTARRSLLKLIPEYTMEFIWIMSKYKACTKEVIQDLLRTPSMKQHLVKNAERLQQLMSKWDCASAE